VREVSQGWELSVADRAASLGRAADKAFVPFTPACPGQRPGLAVVARIAREHRGDAASKSGRAAEMLFQ